MFRSLSRIAASAPGHKSGLELELRLLEERHAAELFALVGANREHLRAWMPWVDATKTEDDTVAFLHGQLEMFASGDGLTAGIWVGGRIVGVIGTLRINWLDRRVEIGYWIAEAMEGKGLVTAACQALVEHVLVELDLHRVEIRCAVGNVRSNRIPERLGFELEGVEREAHFVGGRYQDINRWSMLRQEMLQQDWAQSEKAK